MMKRIAEFLKATTVGGLFVLLPVIIVAGLIGHGVSSVRNAVQALIEKIAGEHAVSEEFPLLIAIVFLLGLSFFLGIGMVSGKGRKVGNWLERTVLSRIPGYSALKLVFSGFGAAEKEGAVKTGLLTLDEGIKCVVFVMEDHGDGWLTVFVPETPNPTTGTVQFVRSDLVAILPARLPEVGPALQHWGIGMGAIVAKSGGLRSLSEGGSGTHSHPIG